MPLFKIPEIMFSKAAAIDTMTPLFLFVFGMVLYSIFIFKFYRFVATRDIFEFNLPKYHARAKWLWLRRVLYVILYLIQYVLIFPVLVTLWFIIFAAFLVLLSDQAINLVLLVSMATVATIRVASYYNEDLSKDVAKMIPFGLLAVFLIDIQFLSMESAINALYTLPTLFDTIVYYLLFAIIIEFILRLFTLIFGSRSHVVETE